MAYRKFDTCFFERYAKLTLETLLGSGFSDLVNRDRPDLQTPDMRLGIEVTRAMEPDKHNANQLLKELAGMDVKSEHKADMQTIVESGYGYGLPGLNYTGHLEYEYWSLAQPLQRILTSKVEKVGKGFYGKFDTFALFVFRGNAIGKFVGTIAVFVHRVGSSQQPVSLVGCTGNVFVVNSNVHGRGGNRKTHDHDDRHQKCKETFCIFHHT